MTNRRLSTLPTVLAVLAWSTAAVAESVAPADAARARCEASISWAEIVACGPACPKRHATVEGHEACRHECAIDRCLKDEAHQP